MKNEILLALSVLLIYSGVIIAYKLFSRAGLYAMTVIATILANIEVLMLVNAFGMEQTLGNVMFASTYLITDILSENEGKKYASKAVSLGVFTSVTMLILTQTWLLYNPSPSDWASPHITAIFSTTPRLLLASFLGYIVSQRFDVWLYHRWWDLTTRISGDSKKFLWLRNNGSTLISQMINTIVFNVIAFAGIYNTATLTTVVISSYVIFIFTSLLDTPAIYFARWLKTNNKIK